MKTLEDRLMDVWVLKDIMDDVLVSACEYNYPDKTANIIVGVSELFDIRMEALWKQFERSLADGEVSNVG